MSTVPKFLFFDLGNVLFRFQHAKICQQISQITGVPVGDITAFVETKRLESRLETGAVTFRDVHQEFCDAFQVAPTLDELQAAASDIFELNTPIVHVVAGLAACHFPIGILSNTSQPHWDFVSRRYRLLSKFPVRSLSYELGVMKPDLAIYQRSSEMVGIAPEEIFFTDDRQENVDGALAAGWQAVLFEHATQLSEELRRRGVQFN